MSVSRIVLLASVVLVATAGCTATTPNASPAPSGSVTVEADAIDLKDAILTNTSADCADYVGQYTASVTDLSQDTAFTMAVVISADEDSCTLISNGIPNTDFDDETAHFATAAAEVAQSFTIPRNPVLADSVTPLSQRYYNGVVLNGVPLDLLSAGCYRPDSPMADDAGKVAIGCGTDDAWLSNPLGAASSFGADAHNAHTQPDGSYHYHGNPLALFDDNPGAAGSPVIGFAADGFPIYGSYFADPATGEVRLAVSGYELISGARPSGAENPPGDYDGTYYDDFDFTGAGDLDACNGMTVNGQYGYYVTDAFPYLVYCLSGEVDSSFTKGAGPA